MRKLSKPEIKFLTYLDQHLDDVSDKNKAFKFLKDDLGLDSKEAAHLYSIWYYTKGEGDYSEIEYDENTLLSFIKKMSSFNSDSERSDYIDYMYDNEYEKLEKIYGDWFNVKCGGWRSTTPCIVWNDDSVTLELDSDDWEKYFSGLGENDLWVYNKAHSSYGDDYDEMDDDEFNYPYTNEETIELLEELAIIAGKNYWPGKDGYNPNEEGVIAKFLDSILPTEYYNTIVSDYTTELGYVVTRSRNAATREEYDSEIKYNIKDASCSSGSYCIEVPYEDLVEIIIEKNLLNLSELKDAEIQPSVYLEDSYYEKWVDEEGIEDVVTEFNRTLRRIIDSIIEEDNIDLSKIIENRRKFNELVEKLGFKLVTKTTNKGDWYRSEDGKLEFYTNDVDLDSNKIKFTYEGKSHLVPIEDLTNWVHGSVLDLNESVRFNKKLLKENKNIITKISIFDFDGTLMDTPHPEEGKKQWEEFTGKEYPHIGWWSKPESLDDAIFDIQPIEQTVEDYMLELKNPNTLVIMLTGRLPQQSKQVEGLLKLHNIQFDEYHYKGNGDTLGSKINTLRTLILRYPNVEQIEMWEDREPHAIEFERWGEENGIDLIVNLVY
jgi:hypothetical protein